MPHRVRRSGTTRSESLRRSSSPGLDIGVDDFHELRKDVQRLRTRVEVLEKVFVFVDFDKVNALLKNCASYFSGSGSVKAGVDPAFSAAESDDNQKDQPASDSDEGNQTVKSGHRSDASVDFQKKATDQSPVDTKQITDGEDCGDFRQIGDRGLFGAAGGNTDMLRIDRLAEFQAQASMDKEQRYHRQKDHASALHGVAAKGTAEDLAELLTDPRVKLQLNAPNVDGETPLHRAVYWSNAAVVEHLLEAKADVNCGDKKGKTPLRKAYQNTEIIRILLDHNADVHATDKHGETTLHRAVEDGNIAVVEMLLEFGANPDKVDGKGYPPLHLAAEQGHQEAVQVLLRKGARPSRQDADGRTASQCAEREGHREIVQLLLAKPDDPAIPEGIYL